MDSPYCIVKGCKNQKHQGNFEGDICSACHSILTTGKPNPTTGILKAIGRVSRITEGGQIALDERNRQIVEEGFTPQADGKYTHGVLSTAGAVYAAFPYRAPEDVKIHLAWPFSAKWYKHSIDSLKNLAKAASLIIAEMDAEIERRKAWNPKFRRDYIKRCAEEVRKRKWEKSDKEKKA